MTISVLMSTYCKEKPEYLDEAMKSIWTDQTRKPDEIILVEDGPLTDELHAVIRNWKNQIGDAFVIVEKSDNQGLALALNDGINIAKGDLIARMDSDDISLPNRFELQEKYMIEHPEVSILGGAIREFNDQGTLNNVCTYPLSNKDILSSMHRGSPLAHPTVMYRRTFFQQGFRYTNKYNICEDVGMWYNAAAAGCIINNLPDTILNFRRNPSTAQRRSKEKAWGEFHAYNDGIKKLNGLFSYKYIFSFLRLCFRLLPHNVINFIYNSHLRKSLRPS